MNLSVIMQNIVAVGVQDHEGVTLHLSVTHLGILVFQNLVRINTFSWAKIRKLSFRRRKFLIKLHPEGYVRCLLLHTHKHTHIFSSFMVIFKMNLR